MKEKKKRNIVSRIMEKKRKEKKESKKEIETEKRERKYEIFEGRKKDEK